jgi:hypothetical protein
LRRTRLSAAGSPENCSSALSFCAPYYSITAAFMQPPMTKMFRARSDVNQQQCGFYFDNSIKIGLPPRIPTPGRR